MTKTNAADFNLHAVPLHTQPTNHSTGMHSSRTLTRVLGRSSCYSRLYLTRPRPSLVASRRFHDSSRSTSSPLRPAIQNFQRLHSPRTRQQARYESTVTVPRQSESSSTSKAEEAPPEPRPEYQLSFTCKKCSERSTHKISKQGYHHGTVLVQCPGCKNRHLISDHLKIFSDKRITLEDILAEKGETLKKAHLEVKMGNDGVLELEKDGS